MDHLRTRAVQTIPTALKSLALTSLIAISNPIPAALLPKHGILEGGRVVNEDIVGLIDDGKVLVRGGILNFDATGVVFAGGERVDVDKVILATGFEIENRFLEEAGSEAKDRRRLYKHVFPTTVDGTGLAFIGLVRCNGSLLPVSELQARWATQVFAGKCTIPSSKEMRDLADVDWLEHRKRYRGRRSMNEYVDSVEYMDEVASMIGVKPDVWGMWRQDWGRAMKLTFGPVVAGQYRL